MAAPTLRSPVLLNEAEAIIEPFWDEHLSPLAHYALTAPGSPRPPRARTRAPAHVSTVGIAPEAPPAFGPLPPDQIRASQFWCFVTLAWDRPPAAKPARRRAATPLLSFTRDLRVTLTGYDRLMVRAACPKHVTLTVVATVDGVGYDVRTIVTYGDDAQDYKKAEVTVTAYGTEPHTLSLISSFVP